MATHKTSFALNEPTIRQLRWLRRLYGTMTAALTVAVHDLYWRNKLGINSHTPREGEEETS